VKLTDVASDVADDEARWAEARSILDRTPTESAGQRLRRGRRRTVFLVASILLVSTAVAAALVVLFRGSVEARPPHVPTWQVVLGFVIAGAGLLLQLCGLVVAWRTNSRLRAWRSPLLVLTRSQQKELLAQVRGRQPIEPARVPLARLRAEHLLNQRTLLVSWCGLEISWVGLWIAEQTVWRAVMTVGYGLLLLVGWSVQQRDVRRAQRFLDEHPQAA
jgi:hypothetical protein